MFSGDNGDWLCMSRPGRDSGQCSAVPILSEVSETFRGSDDIARSIRLLEVVIGESENMEG
jgi:hypothetical protein